MELYTCKWSGLPSNLMTKTRLLKNGLYPDENPVAEILDKNYKHKYALYDSNKAKPINKKLIEDLSINFNVSEDTLADYAIVTLTTTGITVNDEIIEICVLDLDGNFLFQKQFKPKKDIHPKAFAKHSIASYNLSDKKSWNDDWDELKALLEAKIICTNHPKFILSFIKENCNKYNCEFDFPITVFDLNHSKTAMINPKSIPEINSFQIETISSSPIQDAIKILSFINDKAEIFRKKLIAKTYFKKMCEIQVENGAVNGFAKGQQWLELNFKTMNFELFDLKIFNLIINALESQVNK